MDTINERKNLHQGKPVLRKPYNTPKLMQWGTIAEITGSKSGADYDAGTGVTSAYPHAPGRPTPPRLK